MARTNNFDSDEVFTLGHKPENVRTDLQTLFIVDELTPREIRTKAKLELVADFSLVFITIGSGADLALSMGKLRTER